MENLDTVTLGGGCFWCTEAVFQRLKGVVAVMPGYAGGNTENPDYQEVSGGKTGHVESIQIKYDPSIISYEKILEVFFKTHDPTQVDGQGNDTGPQYLSVVFYRSENQKKKAEEIINLIDASKIYERKIVTKLLPYKNFYAAENYHQNYYIKNSSAAYCRIVIDPKIKKLEELFGNILKQTN